jgi:UDP-GlcNAc:undecaprenyl-phosphate GlcNAc-1-phosphate transferase
MPRSDLWCLGISVALALLATPSVRWVALRVGMVDRPGKRKRHGRPTPLLGGVALYLATVAGYLLLAAADLRTLWLMVGGLGLLVVGLWDDRVGLRARFRLALQLLGAAGLAAAGIHFTWFSWEPANWVISMLWLAGLINAVNCLDCADGAAAGTGAIAALAFYFIASAHGHQAVALMAMALLGGCIGFLAFNFPPASIFLGNAGSTLLGFLLGGLAIAGTAAPDTPALAQAWAAALPVAVPIWDIVLVHWRRYCAGIRGLRALLESTGHDHLPHRLAGLGLTPGQAAVAVYLMTALLALPGVMLSRHQPAALGLAIGITVLGLLTGEWPAGMLIARLSSLLVWPLQAPYGPPTGQARPAVSGKGED